MRYQKSNILIPVILLVLVLVFLILPVKIPNDINTLGMLYPEKEWFVLRGPDGRLLTSLVNNYSGVNENYSVTQFERGDAVEFRLHESLKAGMQISTSDTIGFIFSNKSESELIDLKADLSSERALLDVNLSREKQSVIDREKQRLQYAQKQLVEQEKLFNRQKALFEKNLISQEQYELSKGAVDLFKINVEIARERLETVETGSKQEEINYIKSRIDGLNDRIQVLEKRFSDFLIQSPIDGIVVRTFSPDTLLSVSDASKYILFIPININDKSRIEVGSKVEISAVNISESLEAMIYSIEPGKRISNQTAYYIAAARITENSREIIPGQAVNCSIQTESLYPREHLMKFVSEIFGR